jgi:U4/U6 small nuclear ribonucleoprotein PRP31
LFLPKYIFYGQELRYKAAKLVSTKMTLAARVDACHDSTDGRIGRQLREEIEKKLDKLQVMIIISSAY